MGVVALSLYQHKPLVQKQGGIGGKALTSAGTVQVGGCAGRVCHAGG